MPKERYTYDEMIEHNPMLEKVVSRRVWAYVEGCGRFTSERMADKWDKNFKKNLKHIYPKYGSVAGQFMGFAKDKAVIMVGAGPSFNRNKDDLKKVYDFNLQFKLKDQPFVIIASNHQFKPLLEMGIFPHFVMLGDGGGHVYDQLCTDIPPLGQNAVLITTMYADHKIIKAWTRQGRGCCFYIPTGEKYIKLFEEKTGEESFPVSLGQGGNIANAALLLTIKILQSLVFMVIGNDLSYPYDPDVDKRREMFYADGDYSTNIDRNVDEAKDRFQWLGFEMRDNPFEPEKKIIDFKPVGISRQLFIYKTWVETHAIAWAEMGIKYHYYNCSEAGACGVLAKSFEINEMPKDENWYLLDEIIPKRWKTRSLMQAVNEFLEATLLCQMNEDAAGVNLLCSPTKMDIARTVGHRLAI